MIINLNQHRKKRRRAEAETQAKENRVRFGRTKEERTAELRERERAKKEIETKRLDSPIGLLKKRFSGRGRPKLGASSPSAIDSEAMPLSGCMRLSSKARFSRA